MSRFLMLLRVELVRLRARRAIMLFLAAAVVLPLVIAIAVVLDTRPPSASDVASAEQEAASMTDDPFYQRQLRKCLEKPERFGVVDVEPDDPAALQTACEDSTLPRADWFFYAPTLDLDEEREYGSGLAVVAILGVIMFVTGTTFAGHDWGTGSMSNQLLFEPRRIRVWTAKALAVLLATATLSAVIITLYWLGLYAVVSSRESVVGSGVLLDCLQFGWRGAGVAGAAAVGGYALTMLSRSTVFSLGLLFGVSVAGGLLLANIGPRDPGWLDPTINAQAVISDGQRYYVEPPESCFNDRGRFAEDDPACVTDKERTMGEGVTYYGILLGAVGLASIVSFRRRDVP